MRSVRIATAAGIVAAGLALGATGIAQAATPTAAPAPSPAKIPAAQQAQARAAAAVPAERAGVAKVVPLARASAAQAQERARLVAEQRAKRAAAAKAAGSRAAYRVTASRLNVRSGPGTRYRVVSSLARGARISANTSTVDGFREISAGQWVSVHYLSSVR
ncbi:MAG TPA: SH3 domain-containing protein [Pseudonocardiaceae bacterium]|jgi:uncharacterized protein YgiM (DUF1202 family)|nr:SH3 domain-containing protein [Pseudonocardiaceae bacterium]